MKTSRAFYTILPVRLPSLRLFSLSLTTFPPVPQVPPGDNVALWHP